MSGGRSERLDLPLEADIPVGAWQTSRGGKLLFEALQQGLI